MIEATHLTKKYGPKTAVDDLSLTIRQGELFSLLGVNGAGKTTTIRMLACLSTPTGGQATIAGHNCVSERDAVKRVIGMSPQDTAVAENLTVRENLSFIASLYDFTPAQAQSRVDQIMGDFKLDQVENQRAKTLSGGWQRRLSIAMALIPQPRVLFLDEPTLGLDVLARRELWRVIEGLKGSMTIVLTTHYMEEAERLSDRLGVMIAGKLAACGTLADIKAQGHADDLENAFINIAEGEGVQ